MFVTAVTRVSGCTVEKEYPRYMVTCLKFKTNKSLGDI